MATYSVSFSSSVNFPTLYGVTQIYFQGGSTYLHGAGTKYIYLTLENGSSYLLWSQYVNSSRHYLPTTTFTLPYPMNVKGIYITHSGAHYHWNTSYATFTHATVGIDYLSITSQIYDNDVNVQATLDSSNNDMVDFQVKVNGTVVVGWSGWKDDLYNVNMSIPADYFNFGSNTVRFEAKDKTYEYVNYREVTVTRLNSAPVLTVSVDKTTVHSEGVIVNVVIDDTTEEEVISYRVLLNGVQVLPESGYATLDIKPFEFNYAIRNDSLVVGNNTVRVEVYDKRNATDAESVTVTKVNQKPVITDSDIKGKTIFAQISELDGDMVRYRITVNNVRIFPSESEWSKYLEAPINIVYAIPDTLVDYGNAHTIVIEAQDSIGEVTAINLYAVIDYAGIMFCDEFGEFYSTHIGEVLKYLDMGTTVAGDKSNIYKVFVKNTAGYPIHRPALWVDQRDLDLVEERVELSKTDSPFAPEAVLDYPTLTLNHGESFPFYVRINTTRKAFGGGLFDVWVSGDPL